MTEINWEDFKFYKQYTEKKGDNFELLLDFLKINYKMTSPKEMYETMRSDETASLMLNKRDISTLEELEKYLFKGFNAK